MNPMLDNVVAIKIGASAAPQFHTWVKIKRRTRGKQKSESWVSSIRVYHNVSRASVVRALRCQWAFTRTQCGIARFTEIDGRIRYPPESPAQK